MRTSTRTAVCIIVPLIAAAVLVAIRVSGRHASTAPPIAPHLITSGQATVDASHPGASTTPMPPGIAIGPAPRSQAAEPGIFRGWSGWTDAQRIAAVGPLANATSIDGDVLVFCSAALDQQQYSTGLRNDLANVLVAHAADNALVQRLATMMLSQHESLAWRDYALQHLARVVSHAPTPATILALIRQQVDDGPASLPATALLQLDMLAQQKLWTDTGDLDHAIVTMATSTTAALPNRLTAIALIGQRRLVGQADLLRGLVAGPTEPAIQRTAIAALGCIGTVDDIARIEPFTTSADPALVLAARGAMTRLRPATP